MCKPSCYHSLNDTDIRLCMKKKTKEARLGKYSNVLFTKSGRPCHVEGHRERLSTLGLGTLVFS